MKGIVYMLQEPLKKERTTLMANVIKNILRVLIIWLFYAMVTGVLIFYKPAKINQEYKDTSSVNRFYSNEVGSDRVILADDPFKSGMSRIEIIEKAEERLDISCFAIHPGKSANLFFGALIEAADRGVKVNLVLDGIFHGIRSELKDLIFYFAAHPNMELRLYEPINLLKPWTFNNLLHDKYIIADSKIAIIGGRNIGDQYFVPKGYDKKISNDRDMIIINTKIEDKNSVIYQLKEYFNLVWEHSYTKPIGNRFLKTQYKRGIVKGNELKKSWKLVKNENPDLFGKERDWFDISLPTNKITLIHNPIQRLSKEPWCWYEITEIMKSAKQSIFIQSPYTIPNSQLTEGFLQQKHVPNIEVTLLTNSIQTTPNLPAYSGYMRYRKDIVDTGIDVYEYQGRNSIHAKAFVVDELTVMGSFNLDPRSTYLSTETMVVVHSPEVVTTFNENIKDYLDKSLKVAPDYTYILEAETEETQDEERKIPFVKKTLIRVLSYITMWFDYML